MTQSKFHVLIIFLVCPIFAKDIYFTRSGTISFYSSALIEDIEAVNKQVTCVLDMGTGEVAFRVPIPGFTFKNRIRFCSSHWKPLTLPIDTISNDNRL